MHITWTHKGQKNKETGDKLKGNMGKVITRVYESARKAALRADNIAPLGADNMAAIWGK